MVTDGRTGYLNRIYYKEDIDDKESDWKIILPTDIFSEWDDFFVYSRWGNDRFLGLWLA
jgi:hypothetical protein